MRLEPSKYIKQGAWALMLSGLAASAAVAQTRVTVPSGSVILVRTEQALESGTAKVGQTFETTVVEPVSINGYTVVPANSKIRGVVIYVTPASGQKSGVMQIGFDRIRLPNGAVVAIAGKLTSTDSVERRQIDARTDSRVVLVGERGGIGAAIAGAGSTSSSASGILAALGNMLSEGMNVSVPANTQLAVQLERDVTLTGIGVANATSETTIYTAAERIRAAQTALTRLGYYRGPVNGILDVPTRRAIFDFQIRNRITATGNLTGRTANALGVLPANRPVLSVSEAGVVRQAAQALKLRQRQDLGISTSTQMSTTRTYTAADMELLFAFSAFADNSVLYEQFVTASRNSEGTLLSGRALITAARRVDAAIAAGRASPNVVSVWESIRKQLKQVDPTYN